MSDNLLTEICARVTINIQVTDVAVFTIVCTHGTSLFSYYTISVNDFMIYYNVFMTVYYINLQCHDVNALHQFMLKGQTVKLVLTMHFSEEYMYISNTLPLVVSSTLQLFFHHNHI